MMPDATLTVRVPTGATLTVDEWVDGTSVWHLRCPCAMSAVPGRRGEGDRDVMRRLVARHRHAAPACTHVRAGGWGHAPSELAARTPPGTPPGTEAAARERYVALPPLPGQELHGRVTAGDPGNPSRTTAG